ncbi:MAG: NAD(P)H-dependent oxidoreductase [Gemmataceae bacterium]|nr:NAD(P)H-dependent oxidoreductase [Gemmataceae bacterium]MDW8264070.1 NAD(P)H-dependent oxidoreductase [Gemmataceae bacterium]
MILVIAGTNRSNSTSGKVARRVVEIYRELNRDCQLLDLADVPQHCWSSEYYSDELNAKPLEFHPFVCAVEEAKALVIVSPEYNGGIPGALKLFIDLLPNRDTNLVARPVCFIGVAAGEWGGLRPIEQLETVFLYRKAFLFPERVFIRACEDVVSPNGEILDPRIARRLRNQAERFLRFADHLLPLRDLFDSLPNPAALEHPSIFAEESL